MAHQICPHRWMHGVMTCPRCGNNDRGDRNVDALQHELNDWRQFGFAWTGPPITCDQDMRDGIETQFRTLRAQLSQAQAEIAALRACVEASRYLRDIAGSAKPYSQIMDGLAVYDAACAKLKEATDG